MLHHPRRSPIPFGWVVRSPRISCYLDMDVAHPDVDRCRCDDSSVDHTVRSHPPSYPPDEERGTKKDAYSPLDLTKVRLQASGDKRMIESIKKTIRTAGKCSFPSFCPSLSHRMTSLRQASEGCSMASREHGCAKCLTPCVGSGHTTRARSYLGLGRTLLRGSWLRLVVWVRSLLLLICFPFQC